MPNTKDMTAKVKKLERALKEAVDTLTHLYCVLHGDPKLQFHIVRPDQVKKLKKEIKSYHTLLEGNLRMMRELKKLKEP